MLQSDIPIRSKALEAMNFSEISLSGTSAVGIGSSIEITFTFPDPLIQSRREDEVEETSKDVITSVKMYAIPCIDGHLIENEGTLARIIN